MQVIFNELWSGYIVMFSPENTSVHQINDVMQTPFDNHKKHKQVRLEQENLVDVWNIY